MERYVAMPVPIKAALWFTACSIIQRGISVISMPIFTRMMSTEQYGQYSLYMSWYALLSIVVTLNLALEVFNKGLSDHEGSRDRYASSQFGLVTCITLAFLVAYLAFRDYVNTAIGLPTELVLIAFTEAYAGSVVNLWYARKRFDYSYRPIIAVTILVSIMSVIFGILCVYFSEGAWKVFARAISNTIPQTVAALACAVSFLRKSSNVFHFSWWKISLTLALPLLPHYVSQVFLRQADTVMIGWFADDTSVAIYSVAASAGLLLVLVNNGINSSFVPWLYGRMNRGDVEPISKVANSLCVIVFAANAVLMLFAPECVSLLAASDYAEAALGIAPISAGVVSCFVYSLYVNIEIYCGNTSYASMASIIAASIKIALNMLLIPQFGYLAAAYTTAICYFAMVIMHYLFHRQSLRRKGESEDIFDSRFMFACCVASMLMAIACLVLYLAPLLRFSVIVIMLVVAWVMKGRIRSALHALKEH